MMRYMKISKGGQLSVPATVRNRWRTSTVRVTDEGDRLIVEPASDDPIAAAEGALAEELRDFDMTAARARARREEQLSEERKWGR